MSVVHALNMAISLGTAIVFALGSFAWLLRERSVRLRAQRDNASLRQHIQGLEATASLMGHKTAETELVQTELRRRLLALDASRRQLEAETNTLRAENLTALTVIRSLSDEHQRRQKAEDAYAETRALFARTSSELDEMQRALSTERMDRSRSEQNLEAARASLANLESEHHRLASSLDAAEKRAQSASQNEQQLASCFENLRQARSLFEAEQSTRRAAEDQLESTIQSLKERDSELARMQKRLQTSEMRVRTLNSVENELATVTERAAEVGRLSTENASLRQMLQAEREELSESKSRLAEAAAKVRTEQAKTMAADALYQDSMLRWTTAEAELRDLRGRVKTAEVRASDLETRLSEQSSAVADESRILELQAQLSVSQSDLRDTRIKLQASDAKLALLEQLRDENAALREIGRDADDTAQLLSAAQAEVRELRAKLQGVLPKLDELERLMEDNRSLRAQVAELGAVSDAADELERLMGEHKGLKLQSELMIRRLRELESERAELFDLRARVAELSSVADEVSELRRHGADLEAQLFSTIRYSQTVPGIKAIGLNGLGDVAETAADAESVLDELVGSGLARSVALADPLGLLVAAAGERHLGEGLAAFAGLASEMAERARTLLPIGPMVRISICAVNDVKISCRFFHAADTEYGLAAISTGTSDDNRHEKAVDTLADVLSTEHLGVSAESVAS